MEGYIKCAGFYLTGLTFIGMMPVSFTSNRELATKYSHDTYTRVKQTHPVEWESA